MTIAIESPRGPGIAQLLRGGEAHAESLYPAEENFILPVEDQRLASHLLDALEEHARAAGVASIRLETGNRSHAAIALYEKRGYTHIPRFGEYVDSASSVCMEKVL